MQFLNGKFRPRNTTPRLLHLSNLKWRKKLNLVIIHVPQMKNILQVLRISSAFTGDFLATLGSEVKEVLSLHWFLQNPSTNCPFLSTSNVPFGVWIYFVAYKYPLSKKIHVNTIISAFSGSKAVVFLIL